MARLRKFAAYKSITGIRGNIDTINSMIKSRSKKMWITRQHVYNINKIHGYKQEIGFLTPDGLSYKAILVIFYHKKILYRFLFTALDAYYYSGYRDFYKMLKTFRVR